MKTLDTIQTLSKIGKIFSKIVYICCIVGVIGCAVGAVAMCIGTRVIKLDGMTLHSILQSEAGIGAGTVWAAIAVGAVLGIGEIFVSRMAYRYFEDELNAGTPFTEDGAKALMRLGISVLWIPLAAIVLAQIAQGVIAQCMENVAMLDLDGGSVGLGIMFIFMALLCRYGAEQMKDEKTASADADFPHDITVSEQAD